jgi:uncharacterized protein (DUF305 family)
MAEAVLTKTDDRQLRSFAEGIIAAQKREISEMKRFRGREFAQLAPVALASARRARPAR